MTHEQRIQRIYSLGPGIGHYTPNSVKQSDREYLSFGLWEQGTNSYCDAARALLRFVLDSAEFHDVQRILDVACGYGAEAFSLADQYNPQITAALDLTGRHVSYAAEKYRRLGLNKRIQFHQANACSLPFADGFFSHAVSIEGPAQFNTRMRFLREAYRILGTGGEMVLTDAIIGDRLNRAARWERKMVEAVAQSWLVPKDNCVSSGVYRAQLRRAGFEVVSFVSLGKSVFPGYAGDALRRTTFASRIRQRGFSAAVGLTAISYVLGILHKRGLIDYVFVKVRKLSAS